MSMSAKPQAYLSSHLIIYASKSQLAWLTVTTSWSNTAMFFLLLLLLLSQENAWFNLPNVTAGDFRRLRTKFTIEQILLSRVCWLYSGNTSNHKPASWQRCCALIGWWHMSVLGGGLAPRFSTAFILLLIHFRSFSSRLGSNRFIYMSTDMHITTNK